MAIEEALPGVWRIGMGYVNAYLIAGEGAALIDSGLPKKERTLVKALRAAGRKPADLRHVLITHYHADHAGSLAGLEEMTQATTYVGALDAPVVRGEQPMAGPNPASLAGRVLGPLMKRLPQNRLAPARVDHELTDGEELDIAGGLRAIATPGHTPGHVSFLWPEHGGVLFAGDAAGNLFGGVGLPLPMYTEDMAQARESLRKLAALEFEVACFGHGGVLKGEAHAAFKRRVEKLAR